MEDHVKVSTKSTIPNDLTKDDIPLVENNKIYSMFGKVLESQKLTSPIYSFGRANRREQDKIFQSKALIKTQFLCKASPGPIYKYDCNVIKPRSKSIGFSNLARNNDTKKPYIYYDLNDINFDPDSSKIKVLPNIKTVAFKSSSRVK